MRPIALVILSLGALCFACEPRKSSLLPPRPQTASEAAAGTAALQARAPIEAETEPESEDTNPKDVAPDDFSEGEISDLEKVKLDALERLRDLPRDPRQAGRLLRRARSLVLLNQIPEAQEYYLAACQLGQAEGCHKFGWYEQKAGNWKNAAQFYRAACSAGSSKSCNNLGLQLEKQEQWEAALDVYSQACLKRHAVACENMMRARKMQLEARDRGSFKKLR